MATPARVVVLPGEPGPLRVQEVDLPDPGTHHVVVKQFASGICHSQLHQMHAPRSAPGLLGQPKPTPYRKTCAGARAPDHAVERRGAGETITPLGVI